MSTFERRQDMPPAMALAVTQMMESQAYRELAAAQMFGFGLQFVPDLRSLRLVTWHLREEMSHYEAIVKLYQAFTGESVEPRVNTRLAARPIPFAGSWFELAMAQFLYDRGGFWQLRECKDSAYLPYRAALATILREEAGHQLMGERLVVELCASGKVEEVKQACFETWFRQGMLSFGRPGSPGDHHAVEMGLKRRGAAFVMQDFVDDIKPAVKACGLRFPDPKALGLDLPDTLDFSLDGLEEPLPQVQPRPKSTKASCELRMTRS